METKELAKFDYGQLDGNTAEFLRQKESNMREIVGKAYTDLGRELYEAQQRLAGNNQYDGVFERWFTYLGFKKANVYRLIDRYKLVVSNWNEQNLLEDLPVSLTYEIAKPSAESTPAKAQAKAEVLAGEIDTLKAYRERISELEAQADTLRDTIESMREQPPKIEYVEIDNTPHDYQDIKTRLEEYRAKFGDLENYEEHITATHRQDMIVAVMSFSQGVREFLKRYSYMTEYKGVIDNLDDESRQQYDEAVEALKGMAGSFEYTKKTSNIVDAEFLEII